MQKLLSNIKGLFDKSSFEVSEFCLKISGFNGSRKIIQAFLIICVAYATFSEVVFVSVHRKDFLVTADACATLVTGILSLVKSLTFIIKRGNFDGLRDKIRHLNYEGGKG
jgi:hypothetical protein